MGVFSRPRSKRKNLTSTSRGADDTTDDGPDRAGWSQLSWDEIPCAESAAKPMSFKLPNEMTSTSKTPTGKAKNSTMSSKSDHSPIDVMDVDHLPSLSDLQTYQQERKDDESKQMATNPKKKPIKSKNKSKGLSASMHTPSRTSALTSNKATANSPPPQPNPAVTATKKSKGLSVSMHGASKTTTSVTKKATTESPPSQPITDATAAKKKTTNKAKSGLSKSMHAVAKTATSLPLPSLPLTGGNDSSGILKSPGKLIKRVLSSSNHGTHAARKAARNKQLEDLQTHNEKLLKDCKKLKKLLARKTIAMTKLEEAMQQYECPSTLYGQPRSSYDVMKEQADLQMECYEKQLDAKDNKISTLENKNKTQQGRIAYLEILCLQNGISIDEQGDQPKEVDNSIKQEKNDENLDTTRDTDENKRVEEEEDSEHDDAFSDYEDTDDDTASDDDSFACEDPSENQDDIEQDMSTDEANPTSKLGAALGRLEGPKRQSSREQDETSIGITDISKQQSASECQKNHSYAANSWLNLDLGLSRQNSSTLGLPSSVPEECTSGDTASSTIRTNNQGSTGMCSGDLVTDPDSPSAGDDSDTKASRPVFEGALRTTTDISAIAPMLSPVIEGKKSAVKPIRRSTSQGAFNRLEARASLNSSTHSKSGKNNEIQRHSTGTSTSRRRGNEPRSSPNNSNHSKSGKNSGSLNSSTHSKSGKKRGNGRKISPKGSTHSPTRPRCKKDRAAVMGSLEKSLGGSIHFESNDLMNDLIPLVTPKAKGKRNVLSKLEL